MLNRIGPRLPCLYLHHLLVLGRGVLAVSGGTQVQGSGAIPTRAGVPVHKLVHGLAAVVQDGLVRANSLMDGMYNMRSP